MEPFNYIDHFMPHGHCVLWRPLPLYLHVVSDALITLAYITIAITITVFFYKRKDLIERKLYALFAAFIFLCGLCHGMTAVNFWYAYYMTEGILKACTAVVSMLTAFVVLTELQNILKLPSAQMLKRVRAENVKLRKELEKTK